MGRNLISFLLFCTLASAQVQPPVINQNAAAAYQSLLRLRTTATVLHITAHPDDEDGGLITWLARAQGARTGLLTLNRGEGGANLIGPELFDALGLVRTEELLAAGRHYGVDQFFTRVTDFGFSKRLDETLEHWGRENVLRDCVRVVRLYRPDVLVARFHGAQRDGHGNHQTAGLMSLEVFRAAADPNRFPEQVREGLRPWQIKKLYRGVRENENASLRVDTGMYDPLMGASYRQIASQGLSYQRSQGTGGRRADPGPAISAVELVDTVLPKQANERSLFEGMDTTLAGLAKLAPSPDLERSLSEIEKQVDAAIREFDARDPSRVLGLHVAPALGRLRLLIQSVERSAINQEARFDLLFRLRNKEDEFVRAGNLLTGVSYEVLVDPVRAPGPSQGAGEFFRSRATFAVAIPGQKFQVTGTFVNRGQVKMENVELGLSARGQIQSASKPSPGALLPFNDRAQRQFDVTVGENAEPTRPYWTRKDQYRDHLYEINQPQYLNLPYAPPELTGTAAWEVGGVRFTTRQPVQTVSMEGAAGEQRRLLMIAPAMSVQIQPQSGVIPVGRTTTPFTVNVGVMSNAKSDADATVRLELPSGWTASPPQATLHLTHEGEIQNAGFRVAVARLEAAKSYTVQALADYNGRSYREGYQIVAHHDLETRHLYRPATATLTGVDVKVAPGLKAGYVMGVGDEIPQALEQIGVKPQMLGPNDLATGNLAQFDVILVGIRASAVRPDYRTYNSRLLDYVKTGGNLIVHYQTQEFDAVAYGPYPFKMGRRAEEVSEEDARITVLDPANPVFNGPNKITAADFEGWVEERGSKFMNEWDPRYTPLVECHDRGQPPQKGGWLQARYGKGTFTYNAYAFYRQLPAGVPGAYRLFANLISLGKGK